MITTDNGTTIDPLPNLSNLVSANFKLGLLWKSG